MVVLIAGKNHQGYDSNDKFKVLAIVKDSAYGEMVVIENTDDKAALLVVADILEKIE